MANRVDATSQRHHHIDHTLWIDKLLKRCHERAALSSILLSVRVPSIHLLFFLTFTSWTIFFVPHFQTESELFLSNLLYIFFLTPLVLFAFAFALFISFLAFFLLLFLPFATSCNRRCTFRLLMLDSLISEDLWPDARADRVVSNRLVFSLFPLVFFFAAVLSNLFWLSLGLIYLEY